MQGDDLRFRRPLLPHSNHGYGQSQPPQRAYDTYGAPRGQYAPSHDAPYRPPQGGFHARTKYERPFAYAGEPDGSHCAQQDTRPRFDPHTGQPLYGNDQVMSAQSAVRPTGFARSYETNYSDVMGLPYSAQHDHFDRHHADGECREYGARTPVRQDLFDQPRSGEGYHVPRARTPVRQDQLDQPRSGEGHHRPRARTPVRQDYLDQPRSSERCRRSKDVPPPCGQQTQESGGTLFRVSKRRKLDQEVRELRARNYASEMILQRKRVDADRANNSVRPITRPLNEEHQPMAGNSARADLASRITQSDDKTLAVTARQSATTAGNNTRAATVRQSATTAGHPNRPSISYLALMSGTPLDVTINPLGPLPQTIVATDVPMDSGVLVSRDTDAVDRNNPRGNRVIIPRTAGGTRPTMARLKALLALRFVPDPNRIFPLEFGRRWELQAEAVFPHRYGCGDNYSLGLCSAVFNTRRECPRGVNCPLVHKWLSDDVIKCLLRDPNEERAGKTATWLLRALANWLFHKRNGWIPNRLSEPTARAGINNGRVRQGLSKRHSI